MLKITWSVKTPLHRLRALSICLNWPARPLLVVMRISLLMKITQSDQSNPINSLHEGNGFSLLEKAYFMVKSLFHCKSDWSSHGPAGQLWTTQPCNSTSVVCMISALITLMRYKICMYVLCNISLPNLCSPWVKCPLTSAAHSTWDRALQWCWSVPTALIHRSTNDSTSATGTHLCSVTLRIMTDWRDNKSCMRASEFSQISVYVISKTFFLNFQFRPTEKGQFLSRVLLDFLYCYFCNIVTLVVRTTVL